MTNAADVYAQARRSRGHHILGWKLDRAERAALMRAFPPTYGNAVVDHVTLAAKVGEAPLPDEREGRLLGRADDGKGVEAMVVEIGGTTDRPDGSTYHITWSLDTGRRAVESNDVIRDCGWQRFDEPVPLRLTPALWSRR